MADLTPGPRKPVPAELTGFRSALAHTGIPHGVLLWKPRLPSRNWLIFWSVSLSLSYAYYYDRSECKRIKQEVVERVEKYGREPMPGGSLGEPRRVVVWAGRWGGDDDADRAGRYFRKYVKPYLVAAGIDYTLPSVPLHGSITRQLHAAILLQRRQALGLARAAAPLSLPGVLDPAETQRRAVESGVVVVGRASLKEYLEGLRRGWGGGVDEWEWEKEVEKTLAGDGVFGESPCPCVSPPPPLPAPPHPAPPSPAVHEPPRLPPAALHDPRLLQRTRKGAAGRPVGTRPDRGPDQGHAQG
ncbi:mitochondrial import inner membrane translocase subunit TIM54 [Cryptococcus neoformans C23]|nr:mitochondrial import inner membrane translocase subunit TIM54 [Cryptococcus neoformans var. grubii C23]